jgi:glycosyltransferase 2 family protein
VTSPALPEPPETSGPLAPQPPLLLRPSTWLHAAGVVLVAALLWYTLRGLEWQRLGGALRRTRLLPVLVAAGVNFLHHVCKAVYWRTLLLPARRLPVLRLFRYSVAQSVGSVLAPARAGEALRVWMLRKHWGLPVPVTAAAAALEKLGDLNALLVLLLPLPWLWPGRPWWVDRAVLLLLAGAVGAAVLLFFLRRSAWLRHKPFFAGLQLLHSPGAMLLAFAALVGAWLMDLGVIWLVLFALGVPAPLYAGTVILLTVNLAIAVPAAPANAGTLELGAITAFELLGLGRDTGLAFGLVYHGAQVIPILLVGLFDGQRLLREPSWEERQAGAAKV